MTTWSGIRSEFGGSDIDSWSMPSAGAEGSGPRASATETGKISGLRIEQSSGSRNPEVYEDWKRNVESVQFISDLASDKLAAVASMSLAGEATELTRHISLAGLQGESSEGLKNIY